MSTLSETSLPFLASVLPNTSTTNILPASFILVLIATYLAFLTSPARLTRVLAALLDETERVYLWAIDDGIFCACDAQAVQMTSFEAPRGQPLRLLVAPESAVELHCSLAVLQCIWETRRFKTHIEVRHAILCSVLSCPCRY
ncbi:hypothetical protein B0H17DRAFT_1177920 [Mycena rosella]|uniref:Uncharacterized protein n=1 Tax=Mycena rosella TaxID=1033263 RepID=A0AAD7DPY3_MYCRO|nr:hypothetical protein B0H17DRAFT_1177920 [Mycena rosella]